ncbi:MAG: hypothetical protein ACF8Q5_03150, partial [Phycisphaerales bacterium JB040]
MPLAGIPGAFPGADISVFAWYRSFYAYPDGHTNPDQDGTGNLPFGPGWLASWGERLEVPGGPGSAVTRIESSGVSRELTMEGSWTEEQTGLPESSLTSYHYFASKGSRLVYDHVETVASQPKVGIWFRELVDRTRIEYEETQTQGEFRIRRIFYGSDDAGYRDPEWEVVYEYDANGRLYKISEPREYAILLTWTDQDLSAGEAFRVTRIEVDHPTWNPASEYAWDDLSVALNYGGSSYRLTSVEYPNRDFLRDLNGDHDYGDSEEDSAGQTALGFEYQGASDARLILVQRKIKLPGRGELDLALDQDQAVVRGALVVEAESGLPVTVLFAVAVVVVAVQVAQE